MCILCGYSSRSNSENLVISHGHPVFIGGPISFGNSFVYELLSKHWLESHKDIRWKIPGHDYAKHDTCQLEDSPSQLRVMFSPHIPRFGL